MTKPTRPTNLHPIQVTILQDGVPFGGWVGMVPDPSKVTIMLGPTIATPPDVTPPTETMPRTPTDTVEALARRTGTFTAPKAHMTKHQLELDKHDELCVWINPKVKDCSALAVLQKSIVVVWWNWFDDLTPIAGVRKHHERIEKQARLVYAAWLLDQYDVFGKNSQARSARYAVRVALAAFVRGAMRLRTMDSKLEVGRQRLDHLRSSPPKGDWR